MQSFDILSGWEAQFRGKIFYLMIGLFEDNKMKYFNTGSPNFPKFDKDWIALNYFINLADIMVLSNRNIDAEPHLRLYPRSEVLQSVNCEVIEKKRSVVVMSKQGVIDYNNGLFKDDLDFYVYSLQECRSPYNVLVSQEFSLEYMVNRVKELKGLEECSTLCLFGGILFDVLVKAGNDFDLLLFTELMERTDGLPIVGEIDYCSFEEKYSLVFTSEMFRNDYGNWRFRLFRLNR